MPVPKPGPCRPGARPVPASGGASDPCHRAPRGGGTHPPPAQLGDQVGSSLGLPLGKRTSRASVPAGGDGDRATCMKAGETQSGCGRVCWGLQHAGVRPEPSEKVTPSCSNSASCVGCCPRAPGLPREGRGVGCRCGASEVRQGALGHSPLAQAGPRCPRGDLSELLHQSAAQSQACQLPRTIWEGLDSPSDGEAEPSPE